MFEAGNAEKLIGYTFKDKKLLKQCFTHSSSLKGKKTGSNERLEFLGDRVLSFVVADMLYNENPNEMEGFLTKELSYRVSKDALVSAVKKLGLEKFLIVGGGCDSLSDKTMSNIFESVIGGIFIDGGLKAAKDFIDRNIERVVPATSSLVELKELVEKNKLGEYKAAVTKSDGPDHDKSFTVSIKLNGKAVESGSGKSVQEAESAAAERALKVIKSKLS